MKILVSVLFIPFLLASLGAKKVNINSEVDKILNKMNKLKINHRLLNITTGQMATLDGSATVDFAEGMLLGLDSLTRTGDCSEVVEGTKKTFNIQLGLGLLVLVLPKLSLRDVLMSAFFRVGENSLNFTYTIHDKTCRLSVDILRVERFQKVLFGSSRTDFDGTDVNHMFQNGIRTLINKWLDTLRNEIENRLQLRCILPIIKEEIPPTHIGGAFTSLIENIALF